MAITLFNSLAYNQKYKKPPLILACWNSKHPLRIRHIFAFHLYRPALCLCIACCHLFWGLFNFQAIGDIVFKNKHPRLIFRFFLIYGIQYLVGISIINATSDGLVQCLHIRSHCNHDRNSNFIYSKQIFCF